MAPAPSLPDATETLPSRLQTSLLLLQGTAGLWSPCGHSLIPLLLHTAASQSARPGLLGDIFAVPQQAHGFPFLTASHISSSSPQTPPARGGSLRPPSSGKPAGTGSRKARDSSLRSPAGHHQPLRPLNTTQRHPDAAPFPASLTELLFSFPSSPLR